jgi:hypothetical protein
MSAHKADAIMFLKSSIARYGEQLDELQRRLAESAGGLVERTQLKLQQEQTIALIEDAMRLLSQIGGA